MLTYILFMVGFLALIKGADFLVEGATAVALRMHFSPIVIGLTVVAFGTSMPEFIVSAFATQNNSTDIAIGNILGSNIANILLILGAASIIYPLHTQRNTVWKEIPFSLLASVMIAVMANDLLIDGSSFSGLSRIDGIVLLSFFIIFLYYTFEISHETENREGPELSNMSRSRSILFIVAGLVGLMLGGKWITDGAVKIADNLGISESVIGLTVIAIGTSLPELATSAIAAYKKQTDIAIGNVVGSNIFNIFWILGFSSLIRPLPFTTASNLDLAATILSNIILFVLLFIGKKHIIQRWQGVLMLILFIAYILATILIR